jgi:hypothetical protein
MAALSSLLIFMLTGDVFAHLQLAYPAPFNASNNPHRTTPEDPYLQYPYDCCGPSARWQYPCRGYHTILGTPDGSSTAIWAAGSQQNWSMTGIGNHYGGSCQVGFSVDGGENFRVATSYEGNCPHRNAGNGPEGQEFLFTVPHDLTPGVHLFAWTWYNREREFNMNCAAVNITADAEATQDPSQSETHGHDPPASTATLTTTSSTVVAYPTPTYKTANGLSCVCKDPKDISSCDCDCKISRSELETRNEQSTEDGYVTKSLLPFSSRPLMLVADDGNGCLTPRTDAELKFPEPGPDVVSGDGEYPLLLPSGNCTGLGMSNGGEGRSETS